VNDQRDARAGLSSSVSEDRLKNQTSIDLGRRKTELELCVIDMEEQIKDYRTEIRNILRELIDRAKVTKQSLFDIRECDTHEMVTSGAALSKVWNTPEEDKAWQNL